MKYSFEKIKTLFRRDKDFSSEWREQARIDLDFYSGDQWDPGDISYNEQRNRPSIVFNRTATIINSVVGNEIQNRREVQYIGRDGGEADAAAAETLQAGAAYFRDTSDAEDAESEAFRDACICGMGWTETTISYEENSKGDPAKYYRDPLSMFWDYGSRRKCLADRTRNWFIKSMPLEEARELFPGHSDEELDAGWTGMPHLDSHIHDQDKADEYDPDLVNPDNFEDMRQNVRIVHLQYKTKESRIRTQDPITQRFTDYTEDEFLTLNTRMARMGRQVLAGRQVKVTVFREAFIGAVVLDDEIMPVDGFTFECITGYRHHSKGTFYGMVKGMTEPQKMANKWVSQIMHIVSTSGRGVMVDITAVDDMDKFKSSWAQSDEVTEVLPGGTEKIKPKNETRVPPEFFKMMEFAISSIRDVPGVNLEMLGLRGAIQANSLESQRKESGLTILAPLFDALKLYRKREGRVVLQFLQRYLNDGRLVKIVGEANARYVPLAIQADARYDIIVDEAPTSPHMKERVWAFIAPMITKMPPPVISAMLKYSPLPMSVVAELQAVLKKMSEPDPQQQQSAQLETEQQRADIDKTRATAFADRMGAVATQQEADIAMAEFIRSVLQGEDPNDQESNGPARGEPAGGTRPH